MKKILLILLVMFACVSAEAETCRLEKQNRGFSNGHFTYMCFYSCQSGFTFALSSDNACRSYVRK